MRFTSGLSSNRERKAEMPLEPRHSRASGNPPKMGPRLRGDDDVLVLDGKPVILIPAFNGVENLAHHRIGSVGGVLTLALVVDGRGWRRAKLCGLRALQLRSLQSFALRQPARIRVPQIPALTKGCHSQYSQEDKGGGRPQIRQKPSQGPQEFRPRCQPALRQYHWFSQSPGTQ